MALESSGILFRNDMNVSALYQAVIAGIIVLCVSWIGTWVYRRFIRKKKSLPSEQRIEGAVQSASQFKITNSTVNGFVAGRDITIGTYMQVDATSLGDRDEYSETPTPIEIDEAIANAKVPILLRQSVANSFAGVKVRWRTLLYSVRPLPDDHIVVMLRDRMPNPMVNTKVRLSDYPILKTVRGGESLEVTGTIDYVQTNGMIHLKDATLKFLP